MPTSKRDWFSEILQIGAPLAGLALGGGKGLAYGGAFATGMQQEQAAQQKREDEKKAKEELEAKEKEKKEREKKIEEFKAAELAENWDKVESLGREVYNTPGLGKAGQAEKKRKVDAEQARIDRLRREPEPRPTQQRTIMDAQGRPHYQEKIGGKWVTTAELGPAKEKPEPKRLTAQERAAEVRMLRDQIKELDKEHEPKYDPSTGTKIRPTWTQEKKDERDQLQQKIKRILGDSTIIELLSGATRSEKAEDQAQEKEPTPEEIDARAQKWVSEGFINPKTRAPFVNVAEAKSYIITQIQKRKSTQRTR